MTWRISGLAPLAVVGLAVAFTAHRIDTFDFWYHLAGGRLMVETWTWPTVNTFAFTTPDHPWIDVHWGFQLLLYAAYQVGGAAACTLLVTSFIVGATLVLYRLACRSVSPAVAALLVAVAMTVASPRLMPRPESISFLLLALYLAILEGQPANGRWVWALVPLQVVWANVQGIFPLGLVVIGGYWAGATLAFLPVPAGWRVASGLPPRAWRRLTLVLVCATFGCLLNPYGLEGALFPLELVRSATGGSLVSSRIGELRGPFEARNALVLSYLWATLVVVAAGSTLLRVRRVHLGRLLVAGAFAVLATQALRHMALFAWVAVPVIAANLGRVDRERNAEGPDIRGKTASSPGALGALIPVGILVLACAVATNHFSRLVDSRREFGLGVATQRFPVEAVAFLDRLGITGRPFNCLAMGGYLIWHYGGGESPQAVFVDGRLETYPASVFHNYFRAIDNPKTFARLAKYYQPDFIVLYHAWGNRLPLVTYLAAGHGWTMVYYDDNTAVFLPDDEPHREDRERAIRAFDDIRLARLERPAAVPSTSWERLVDFPIAERWYQHRYGEFLREMRLWPEAAEAYERALAADPTMIETRFSLGMAYWYAGARPEAREAWREVVRRAPDFEPAQRALIDAAAIGS